MATTKIWAIKDSLFRVLDYAANPKKTVYSDLQKVLHYAENEAKTQGDESACYMTGVNCNAKAAFSEMLSVQQRFGKTGGNVAYHAYQSFKTGEVTPELCHQLGVELAQRMWGSEYQVLVATHLDTGTYHNHFVLNAVNMWDGKKFDCNEGVYWRFRALSDELCAEHRLTVIKNPMGKTPRKLYFAEKNGEPTKFNLMRQAIDYAVSVSASFKDFRRIMSDQGYEINLNPNRRYWTIRSVNSSKAVRMYRLGEDYTNEAIDRRIRERGRNAVDSSIRYLSERKQNRQYRPKLLRYKGCLIRTKKHTGLYALYLQYCYLLGYFPKKQQHRPLSPEMREAWRHISRMSDQVRLISKEKLHTLDDVHSLITDNDRSIQEVTTVRQKIYNKLRHCDDAEQRAELLHQRDDCSAVLKQLRKEKRVALTIIEDNPLIKENIRIETQMRNEVYGLQTKQKSISRSYTNP